MNTKEKILNASLKLYNSKGVSNVSLRAIADEVGISVGNLQYHFKKREEIVEALYFQIVEKIDVVSTRSSKDLLGSFLTISTDIVTILFEYHFFLLDFTAITRKNKKIKKHYAELSIRREKEFLMIADALMVNGYFRKELIKGEYQSLFKRTEVFSNFWFSSLLIQGDTLSKKAIKEYTLLVNQSIYPYLTEKGRSMYFKMFPDQEP